MKDFYTKEYFLESRQRTTSNNKEYCDLVYRNRKGSELMFFGTLKICNDRMQFKVFNNTDPTKHEKIEIIGRFDFEDDLAEINPLNHLLHWAFIRHMQINTIFTFRLVGESRNDLE